MRVLIRTLIALAAIALSCLAQEPSGDLHISGTVTNSQTGQPVKQALVTATGFSTGKPVQRAALTDATGNFYISGLGKGRCVITVQKDGYRAHPEAVQSFGLDSSRDSLSLTLEPFGKISGQVLDSDGEPVPGVAIRALHVVISQGRRTVRQDRSVSTNDQGRYRLWNLPPGDYYIVAAGRSGGTVNYVGPRASGGVHEGFAPVYYPQAPDQASATPLTMTPGQELTADLKIAIQPAYRVRGALRNFSPGQGVRIELLRGAGSVTANRIAVNVATGRFEASDVVPGSYILRASQGKGEAEIRGEIPVQINRTDLDGLVVELQPGVTVAGEVRGLQEVDDPIRPFLRRGCSISLRTLDADPSTPLSVITDGDGKFAFNGVHPGRYQVQVNLHSGYAASVSSGTTDLTHGAELLVASGVPPHPIEIVARYDGAAIEGTVDQSLGISRGANVLLVPVAGGSPLRTLVMDNEFAFGSLPPGDYRAFLFRSLDDIEYTNPAVTNALKGGESLHLAAGEKVTLTLKAIAQ
jgi:hypothetical protein